MAKKNKHNKKRNTAFLYECLIRDLTESVIRKDLKRRDQILSVIKKHFSKERTLYKELKLYKSLYDVSSDMAEDVLKEAQNQHRGLDKKKIFNEQSKLISDINTTLSNSTFNMFVPNYRFLANLYNLLSLDTDPQKRVVLEREFISEAKSKENEKKKELQPISNIVYQNFIKRFNEKYESGLLKEQKELLNHFILSVGETHSTDLKLYLNEEISRLKTKLRENNKEGSPDLSGKIEKIKEVLQGFSSKEMDKEGLHKIINIQQFVYELENQ